MISLGSRKFGVVEAKYPYKHHKNSIEEGCKEIVFCLSKEDGQLALDRGVSIISTADMSAADMLIFTVSVIGADSQRRQCKCQYSACKDNFY